MNPRRDPFRTKPVTSRRGGPAKKPLSREAIVDEALRLLSRHGKDGLSLRRVAAALKTGPASLYAYVDDLEELLALVIDRALERVQTDGSPRAGWKERLHRVLRSYGGVLYATPGLAPLALTTVAVGPHALRIYDALLGLLAEAGVDDATAAWAVDLLVLYVTAIVAEHGPSSGQRRQLGTAVTRAIASASATEYPRVHAARALLLSGTGEQRFEWAVEVILAGIVKTKVRSRR